MSTSTTRFDLCCCNHEQTSQEIINTNFLLLRTAWAKSVIRSVFFSASTALLRASHCRLIVSFQIFLCFLFVFCFFLFYTSLSCVTRGGFEIVFYCNYRKRWMLSYYNERTKRLKRLGIRRRSCWALIELMNRIVILGSGFRPFTDYRIWN